MTADYDVAYNNTRVYTASGQVVDNTTTDRNARLLKQANLWDNCVFFADVARGVKKDANQYVSKVYDLKANADLLQSTGTAQPKYQSDGSLLFDGGDGVVSPTLDVSNPIRTSTASITVIIWVKRASKSTPITEAIFARFTSATSIRAWSLLTSSNPLYTNGFYANIPGTDQSTKKTILTPSIICDNTWHCVAFTFDTTQMMDGKIGLLKLYNNGVNIGGTISTNLDCAETANVNTAVAVGRSSSDTPFYFTGATAIAQIYNKALTPEQILWNYNNIRPEGV